MIVEPDFPDHWKTQLLIQLTSSAAAPIMVIRLWAHCQQRKAWEFADMSDAALAAVCRWQGEPAQLRKHLADAGFIEKGTPAGIVIVHEWDEVNATLVRNWKNGPKGGRPITQLEPSGNPTVTDKIEKRGEEKIDRIGEDRNTPQPPAGGAASARAKKTKTGLVPDAQPEPLRSRMLALNRLPIANRRGSSKWDGDEVEALKASGLLDLSAEDFTADVEAMSRLYSARIPREMEVQFCRRTGLLTLLRHWSGELDKARRWQAQQAPESENLPRLSSLRNP